MNISNIDVLLVFIFHHLQFQRENARLSIAEPSGTECKPSIKLAGSEFGPDADPVFLTSDAPAAASLARTACPHY